MEIKHVLLIKYSTTYREIHNNLPCVVRMPYTIRKCPNQDAYKVYSESGRPLSKKCLPLERAKKQRTAAFLSETGLSATRRRLPRGTNRL